MRALLALSAQFLHAGTYGFEIVSVRQEVAEGGYSTPSDFVRTVLRERRAQKLRGRLDEALLASLATPAEEVTPEYLASLRQEVKALISRKAASRLDSPKEV